MVEEGIAAIALFPSDPERLAPVIDRAADKGVSIITIDGDVPESKRLSNIGTDPFKMGVMAGEAAIRHLPDGGSVVVLLCAAGLATVKKRFEGFRQTIARKGSIRITEKVEMPGTDMQETEKQLQGLLGRNGSADLLYVVTDESSVVAAKLLKETGRKIKLVCIANSSEVMQYVRQGIVSSQLCMRNRLWENCAATYRSGGREEDTGVRRHRRLRDQYRQCKRLFEAVNQVKTSRQEAKALCREVCIMSESAVYSFGYSRSSN